MCTLTSPRQAGEDCLHWEEPQTQENDTAEDESPHSDEQTPSQLESEQKPLIAELEEQGRGARLTPIPYLVTCHRFIQDFPLGVGGGETMGRGHYRVALFRDLGTEYVGGHR